MTAGRVKFNPRELMEQAIEVMRQSIPESIQKWAQCYINQTER